MKIKILPVMICLGCIFLRVFPSYGQTSREERASTVWATVIRWNNEVPTTTADKSFTIAVSLRSNDSL
jgi:hypothetical protein